MFLAQDFLGLDESNAKKDAHSDNSLTSDGCAIRLKNVAIAWKKVRVSTSLHQ